MLRSRLLTIATIALIFSTVIFSSAFNSPAVSGTVFTATAYSLRGRTASGTSVAVGTVAADPRVLRLGTKIHIDAPGNALDGIYTVRDTGGKIKGKRIDIWMPNRKAAMKFGKRKVRVTRL